MLKSMTAFARCVHNFPEGRVVVQIQSVNKRYFDCSLQLPKELSKLESDVRKWVSSRGARGQVSVSISFLLFAESNMDVRPNLPLAKKIKTAFEQLCESLDIPKEQASNLNLLCTEHNLLNFEEELSDESYYRDLLKEAVFQALEEWNERKEVEGEQLYNDLHARVPIVENELSKIRNLSPNACARFREKLQNTLEEFLPGNSENEDRLLKEAAVFAEKVDITEELTRLDIHIRKLYDLLQTGGAVGKNIEFLLQEMNREVNTLGSKSSDAEISHHVVTIKSELEKVREQLQNVE